MNRITINGKTITCLGTNVVINNGKIIVDTAQLKRHGINAEYVSEFH